MSNAALDSEELPFHSRITIPCESVEQAEIMCQVLSVDEELQPNKLVLTYSTNKDSMTKDSPHLFIDINASDLRMLRVGVSSALDMILVSAKTLLQFS